MLLMSPAAREKGLGRPATDLASRLDSCDGFFIVLLMALAIRGGATDSSFEGLGIPAFMGMPLLLREPVMLFELLPWTPSLGVLPCGRSASVGS